MKQYLKNQSGFTLVEMLVGLLVSGIIMAGAVSVFSSSVRLNTQTERRAQMQIEACKALDDITSEVRVAKGVAVADKTINISCYDGRTISYGPDKDDKNKLVKKVTTGGSEKSSNLVSLDNTVEFDPTIASTGVVTVKMTLSRSNVSNVGANKTLQETVEATVSSLPIN